MENILRATRTKNCASGCTNIIWSHVIININKLNQIIMYKKKLNKIDIPVQCSILSDHPSPKPKFVTPVLVHNLTVLRT